MWLKYSMLKHSLKFDCTSHFSCTTLYFQEMYTYNNLVIQTMVTIHSPNLKKTLNNFKKWLNKKCVYDNNCWWKNINSFFFIYHTFQILFPVYIQLQRHLYCKQNCTGSSIVLSRSDFRFFTSGGKKKKKLKRLRPTKPQNTHQHTSRAAGHSTAPGLDTPQSE